MNEVYHLLYLVMKLRISAAIPLLPLHAFTTWTGVLPFMIIHEHQDLGNGFQKVG